MNTITALCEDLVLAMDEVPSESDVDCPVFYHEVQDSPGVCVDHGDGRSPIKISKSSVKVGVVDSSEDDLNPSDWLILDYQPREGVPGFEVETRGDMFWTPIVYGIQNRFKASPTS